MAKAPFKHGRPGKSGRRAPARRRFALKTMAAPTRGLLLALCACAAAGFDYDILVYGASSAGVAAAITASANGTRSVALVA